VTVKTHVHSAPVSDVARSIVEHAAAEFMPDLIVISTHGSSGVRGVLFGSIAQQVVAQGRTPLLLIRPESPKFKLTRILLPLDPDSRHDDSLPLAESLAKIFKAELALFSVVPTYSTLAGEQAAASSLMPATTQALLDVQEENALEHLKQHVKELSRRGIAASADVRRGDPAQIIVKTAEQSGADLIALSTHGKSGIGAFWARSVSPKVAQRTKTPVLLIPLVEPA
jgi:nucleotide-binding universal stress UspA family protein